MEPHSQTAPQADKESNYHANVSALASRRREKAQVVCAQCRRRKTKCDRTQPCSSCRKGNRECYYPNPPIQFPEGPLTRLSSSAQRNAADIAQLQRALEKFTQKIPEQPKPPIVEDDGKAYVDRSMLEKILGEIKTVNDLLPESNEPEYNGNDLFLGVPNDSVSKNFASYVPSHHDAKELVDYFFESVELSPLIVHAPTFYKEFDTFWNDPTTPSTMWFAMFFGILSLSSNFLLLSHVDPAKDTELKANIRKYREICVECLRAGGFAEPVKYNMQALILYLACERMRRMDIPHSFAVVFSLLVSLAQRMDYHKDPDLIPSLTPYEKEIRRRLWALVVQFDFMVSSATEKPRLVREKHTDNKPPLNLNSEKFLEDSGPQCFIPERRDTPTTIIFVMGRQMVVRCLHGINELVKKDNVRYEQVLRYDQALNNIRNELPRYTLGEGADALNNLLFIQHLTFECLFEHARCTLHRRYVSVPDPAYAYSRLACVDAALKILGQQRQVWAETRPGRRLARQKWKLNAYLNRESLVATVILSLHITHMIKIRNEPVVKLPPGYMPVSLKGKMDVLERSYMIWETCRPLSTLGETITRVVNSTIVNMRRYYDNPIGGEWRDFEDCDPPPMPFNDDAVPPDVFSSPQTTSQVKVQTSQFPLPLNIPLPIPPLEPPTTYYPPIMQFPNPPVPTQESMQFYDDLSNDMPISLPPEETRQSIQSDIQDDIPHYENYEDAQAFQDPMDASWCTRAICAFSTFYSHEVKANEDLEDDKHYNEFRQFAREMHRGLRGCFAEIEILGGSSMAEDQRSLTAFQWFENWSALDRLRHSSRRSAGNNENDDENDSATVIGDGSTHDSEDNGSPTPTSEEERDAGQGEHTERGEAAPAAEEGPAQGPPTPIVSIPATGGNQQDVCPERNPNPGDDLHQDTAETSTADKDKPTAQNNDKNPAPAARVEPQNPMPEETALEPEQKLTTPPTEVPAVTQKDPPQGASKSSAQAEGNSANISQGPVLTGEKPVQAQQTTRQTQKSVRDESKSSTPTAETKANQEMHSKTSAAIERDLNQYSARGGLIPSENVTPETKNKLAGDKTTTPDLPRSLAAASQSTESQSNKRPESSTTSTNEKRSVWHKVVGLASAVKGRHKPKEPKGSKWKRAKDDSKKTPTSMGDSSQLLNAQQSAAPAGKQPPAFNKPTDSTPKADTKQGLGSTEGARPIEGKKPAATSEKGARPPSFAEAVSKGSAPNAPRRQEPVPEQKPMPTQRKAASNLGRTFAAAVKNEPASTSKAPAAPPQQKALQRTPENTLLKEKEGPESVQPTSGDTTPKAQRSPPKIEPGSSSSQKKDEYSLARSDSGQHTARQSNRPITKGETSQSQLSGSTPVFRSHYFQEFPRIGAPSDSSRTTTPWARSPNDSPTPRPTPGPQSSAMATTHPFPHSPNIQAERYSYPMPPAPSAAMPYQEAPYPMQDFQNPLQQPVLVNMPVQGFIPHPQMIMSNQTPQYAYPVTPDPSVQAPGFPQPVPIAMPQQIPGHPVLYPPVQMYGPLPQEYHAPLPPVAVLDPPPGPVSVPGQRLFPPRDNQLYDPALLGNEWANTTPWRQMYYSWNMPQHGFPPFAMPPPPHLQTYPGLDNMQPISEFREEPEPPEMHLEPNNFEVPADAQHRHQSGDRSDHVSPRSHPALITPQLSSSQLPLGRSRSVGAAPATGETGETSRQLSRSPERGQSRRSASHEPSGGRKGG